MRVIPKSPLNNSRIMSATHYATERAAYYAERAKTIAEDPERAERLTQMECQICWKQPKVGGCMCTTKECDQCGTEMRFGSTNTDHLCLACAKSLGVCKHCLADIDLKQRRKLWIKKGESE